MAENVGSIEINVDVDTHTMSSQVQRAADRAARVYGTTFNKSAGRELNQLFTPVGARLLSEASEAGDLAGEGFADHMRNQIVQRVRRWDLDIAEGVTFGNWRGAVSTFDDMDESVTRITARLEHLNREGEITDEQFDSASRSLERWTKAARKASEEEREMARQARAAADAARDTAKINKDRDRVILRTAKAQQKLNVEEERSFSVLGRLKGARNDFLNIIGIMALQVERLPEALGKAADGFKNFASGIAGAIGQLRGGEGTIRGITGALRGMGGSLSAGTFASGGAAIISVAAAFELLGVAAAGLSQVTGIVTALAASIANALGGAVLSVLPLLGALVTGVGAVTLAVLANKDAFSEAIKPLKDWAAEAGKAVGKALLPKLSSAAKDLGDTLRTSVTPLLRDAGAAVGDFAQDFADALGSSAMKENLKTFRDTWPGILTNLGRIFTSAFTGISGVIAAISPQVEDITDEIADAFEGWSDWANSAEGKNSIATWFNDAWESAKKLWKILSNVGTAIGNVFGIGDDTGDDFLSKLVDITDEFAKWTDSEEGREQIKQWFSDAKDTASDLWDIIETIGEWFDTMDTEENRKNFQDLLGVINAVLMALDGVSTAIEWLDAAWDNFWESIDFSGGDMWFIDWGSLFSGIGEAIGTAWNPVYEWWNGTVLPWFEEAKAGASEAWNEMWSSLGSGFSGAWASVQEWWNGTVLPWFASLGPGTSVFFQQMWQGLVQWAVNVWVGVQTWWNGTVLPFFASIPASISVFFQQMWQGMLQWGVNVWVGIQGWWNGTVLPFFASIPASISVFFQQMWQGMLQAGVTAWGRVQGWWNGTVVPFFAGLKAWALGRFTAMWNTIYQPAVTAWGKVRGWWNGTVVPFFANLKSMALGHFTAMWNSIYQPAVNAWSKVRGWWNGTVIPFFANMPSQVRGYFEDMWNGLYQSAVTVVAKIRTWWFGTALPNIKSFFSTDTLYEAGQNLISGLLEGIKSIPVIGTAASIAEDLIGSVNRKLGNHSPSKVFRGIGQNTMEGFRLGMLDRQRALLRTANQVGSVLDSAIGGGSSWSGSNVNAGSGGGRALRARGGITLAEGAIQVITPTHDPVQVAQMTVDRLVRTAG